MTILMSMVYFTEMSVDHLYFDVEMIYIFIGVSSPFPSLPQHTKKLEEDVCSLGKRLA